MSQTVYVLSFAATKESDHSETLEFWSLGRKAISQSKTCNFKGTLEAGEDWTTSLALQLLTELIASICLQTSFHPPTRSHPALSPRHSFFPYRINTRQEQLYQLEHLRAPEPYILIWGFTPGDVNNRELSQMKLDDSVLGREIRRCCCRPVSPQDSLLEGITTRISI